MTNIQSHLKQHCQHLKLGYLIISTPETQPSKNQHASKTSKPRKCHGGRWNVSKKTTRAMRRRLGGLGMVR